MAEANTSTLQLYRLIFHYRCCGRNTNASPFSAWFTGTDPREQFVKTQCNFLPVTVLLVNGAEESVDSPINEMAASLRLKALPSIPDTSSNFRTYTLKMYRRTDGSIYINVAPMLCDDSNVTPPSETDRHVANVVVLASAPPGKHGVYLDYENPQRAVQEIMRVAAYIQEGLPAEECACKTKK